MGSAWHDGAVRTDVTVRLVAAARRVGREPLILILITAGIFEILSGDPISHGVLLFLAAGIVAREQGRRRGDGPSLPSGRLGTSIPQHDAASAGLLGVARTIPRPAGLAIAAAYAAIVGGFARFTWPMTVAILIPGGLALAAAWGDRSPRPPRPRVARWGLVAWASVLVALGLWELTQLLLQPSLTVNSYAHPTISYLMDPLLNQHRVDRSLAIFAWLSLGWVVVDR
jgi:hypothetical protein